VNSFSEQDFEANFIPKYKKKSLWAEYLCLHLARETKRLVLGSQKNRVQLGIHIDIERWFLLVETS
jgi:hypothetical protein